jgi:biopolymer transport protein ExbD
MEAQCPNAFRHAPSGASVPQRPLSALRMAPMIDIIFLLLIFFLVAARWRPQEDFLPMTIPAAASLDPSAPAAEPLVFEILAAAAGCSVEIGAAAGVDLPNGCTQTDMERLRRKIRGVITAQKRLPSDPVEIICDESVTWDHIAKIYDCLFGEGLTNITFRMTE